LLLFNKDYFSDPKIRWKKVNNIILTKFIKEKIFKNKKIKNLSIYKNSGLEINSNNFKILCNKKLYLLKGIETCNQKKNQISNNINLINWLKKNKTPVPSQIKFFNDSYIINFRGRNWILNSFVEGNHFKGNKKEFHDIIKKICSTTKLLKRYPNKMNLKIHNISISHLNKIITIMSKNKKKWVKFFGKKQSDNLSNYWKEINDIIDNLKSINYDNKNLQLVHVDIHPHNIITKKNKLISFLDFESWMLSSLKEALAYGGFKLCRQVVLKNKNLLVKKSIGKEYISKINKYYGSSIKLDNNFLLICEKVILERLVNIFKFNLFNKNRQWNKFIPIFLSHLDESKIIFKYNKTKK
jgi:hypothetical protein